MNSDKVLSKIMTLLSLGKEEVELAFARLDDGTVLESPSFDVGEPVEVVGEDDQKSPAPDGEHDLTLRDEEGNETRFQIIVSEGRITERNPIEELQAEIEEVEPLPNTTDEPEENTVEFQEEIVGEDTNELPKPDVVELEKRISKMEATIEEIKEMIAEKVEEVVEDVAEELEEEEDEDVLTGAPVEMSKQSFKRTNPNKKMSLQDKFLTKLYK